MREPGIHCVHHTAQLGSYMHWNPTWVGQRRIECIGQHLCYTRVRKALMSKVVGDSSINEQHPAWDMCSDGWHVERVTTLSAGATAHGRDLAPADKVVARSTVT